MLRQRYQRGFTLLELGIVAVILVVMSLIWGPDVVRWASRGTYLDVARQTSNVAAQCKQYQKANSDSLLASATWPVVVTTAQLVDAGYAVSDTPNTYAQRYECRFVKDALGGLRGIVLSVGGRAMSGTAARDIAKMITENGGSGAYIDTARLAREPGPANLFSGAGLNEPLAPFGGSPGPGHVADAIFYANEVQAPGLGESALQRDNIPGHPEYNQMNTTLDLNGHAVVNGGTLTAASIGSAGMSPDSGYPAGLTAGVHTRDVYAEGTIGTGTGGTLMASITPGGAIGGQSLNIAGDEQIGGYARFMGDGGPWWQKYGIGMYAIDTSWVRISGSAGLAVPGQIQGGSIVSNGRLITNELLQVSGPVTLLTTCPSVGLVGKATDGSGLAQCRPGPTGVLTWLSMQGLLDAVQIVSGSSSCGNTANVVLAQCPAGTRVTGGTDLLNAYRPLTGADQVRAPFSSMSGNAWSVQATSVNGNSCFVAMAVCAR